MRTRLRTLLVVALLLASSGAASATTASTASSAADQSVATNATGAHDAPATNATIGYFDGYWYDTPINVDQSDGLNGSEIHAYVRRTMARVERLRDHNFEHAVPVHVTSRAAYRANQSSGSVNATYARWNQQVWEAALIVGSDTNLSSAMTSYYSDSVQGFYSPTDDAIEIIVPSGKHAYIENATLAHELTHALQDQHYDLTKPKYAGETQDAQLAADGLVEGEARYIQNRYAERCANGTWQCVATPSSSSSGSSSTSGSSTSSSASPPYSLQYTLYFPYASGPGYVHDLLSRGGWDAVDAAWRHPPNTTTEIIHGDAPARTAVDVDRDAATNGWRPFSGVGANGTGTDTLGEASIFTGFWWQSYHYGANVVPTDIRATDGYRTIRYDATASSGWTGDTVLPYHRGDAGGFVWKSAWNTSDDANAFADAYVGALKAHGASRRDGVWVVSKRDGYQGAYRVVRSNDTVTVVSGPNTTAVNDIRPALADDASATTSGGSSPGLGALVGLLSLCVAALLHRRR
ncbi:hypothetical protein MBEHAL_1972 [Halarchaeum acidiphilum MH1-52-1]|uniref:PGF-CTERM sorting domain-containing protein n=1 Tax=Halarchaeum acidiphilum MH1-52-1 TaxID=1261545 RepID=U2YWP3_9EURY|nr:Hvo_1808 family surface protein [Halarchaeum acidiphilum]GAD53212.1 hypothetical protein MBEHAL_1972 [Halarchaeum acidiphilum MH1-52-1]